jgi:hypothetical protein
MWELGIDMARDFHTMLRGQIPLVIEVGEM